jgi:hypothetical protein
MLIKSVSMNEDAPSPAMSFHDEVISSVDSILGRLSVKSGQPFVAGNASRQIADAVYTIVENRLSAFTVDQGTSGTCTHCARYIELIEGVWCSEDDHEHEPKE